MTVLCSCQRTPATLIYKKPNPGDSKSGLVQFKLPANPGYRFGSIRLDIPYSLCHDFPYGYFIMGNPPIFGPVRKSGKLILLRSFATLRMTNSLVPGCQIFYAVVTPRISSTLVMPASTFFMPDSKRVSISLRLAASLSSL